MVIHKTVMVSVVGRANTGKSTLVNTLVGRKVAITSPKPQTTRTRITGVLDRADTQFVFLDTPGLHRPRSRLGECMVRVAGDTVANVDAAVLVVEPLAEPKDTERELAGRLKEMGLPAVLAVNKIDLVQKEALLAVIAAYASLHDWQAVVPLCARTGEGTDVLLDELERFALPGGRLFPEGMITDQPDQQLAAEMIREKLLMSLEDEVPHGVAVEVTEFCETAEGVLKIGATIYCEKESHKGIIIGKKGAMLKTVGAQARAEMEAFFGQKVFLETWVKTRENWRENPNFIRKMGLDER